MAARVNRRREPTAHYVDACRELADGLGYPLRPMLERFAHLALMREFEQRMPRAVAEWLAFRDIRFVYDKRGQAPS